MDRDYDYDRERQRREWERNRGNDWGAQEFRSERPDDRHHQPSPWDWGREQEHQRDAQRFGTRGQGEWQREQWSRSEYPRDTEYPRDDRYTRSGGQDRDQEWNREQQNTWRPRQNTWNSGQHRRQSEPRQQWQREGQEQNRDWNRSENGARDRGYGNSGESRSGDGYGRQQTSDRDWAERDSWNRYEPRGSEQNYRRDEFDNRRQEQHSRSRENEWDDRQDNERLESNERRWGNQQAYERGLGAAGGWGREGERWSERQGGGMYQGSWNANRGEEDWGRDRGQDQQRRDDNYEAIRNEFYGARPHARREGQATRGFSPSHYDADQGRGRGAREFERSPRSRRQYDESR